MMRCGRRGFTLLELIVAMVIVSIITGALFASLRTGFHAKASIEQAVEPLQRAGIAMDFLRRDMESALLPTGVLANAFVGTDGQDDRGRDADDLVFFAAVDGPSTVTLQTDMRQIEYTVQAANNDHLLVRRVTSNLLSPTTLDPDDEILCRGVLSFNLSYYDGTDWYDAWDSTQAPGLIGPQQAKSLPLAVQVTLQLEPTTPGGEPVQITRLIGLPCAVPATQPTGSAQATGGSP